MSGGVRNLRAMFENKDSTSSPPERGRSPGESAGASSTGTSPRPISKVRTSFVTVEKSGQLGGQLGLKRSESESTESTMTKRRTSFSLSEQDHPKETEERKESIAAEFAARAKNSLIREIVPEVAVETPALEVEKKLELPRSPAVKKEVKSEPAMADVKKVTSAANGHSTGPAKPAESDLSKPASKPAPITTARTSTAAKASPSPKKVKSPPVKTPTTPRSTTSKAAPQEKIEKNVEKKEEPKKTNRNSAQPSQTTKPASKPPTQATRGSAPKTKIPASPPPQTGFHKPRPKSPTRPVKLPASLTTHTASSGAKTSTGTTPPQAGRQSLSRASGNPQPSRSPSRTSATAAKNAVSRSASTLRNGSSRPSLGPPPAAAKKQANRQSLPPADDSFLARMMRPTTSSASKVHEDKPSEPKRAASVKRPTTRDGPKHHETAKAAVPTHKKEPAHVSAKTVAKDTKPAAKTEQKASSPVKPAVKAEPKIASPAKPHSKANSPTKKEEPKPEATPPIEIKKEEDPAVETALVSEVKEIQAVAPKVEEALKVEETPKPDEVKVVEPVASGPEKKQEESAVDRAPLTEAPKTPSKSDNPEPLKSPEKDLSTIEESPAPAVATKSVGPPVEETKSATPLPIQTKPDAPITPSITSPIKSPTVEDPEDIKAREEIAKLNAELMKGAEVD